LKCPATDIESRAVAHVQRDLRGRTGPDAAANARLLRGGSPPAVCGLEGHRGELHAAAQLRNVIDRNHEILRRELTHLRKIVLLVWVRVRDRALQANVARSVKEAGVEACDL